jgi:hypothetical protein
MSGIKFIEPMFYPHLLIIDGSRLIIQAGS